MLIQKADFCLNLCYVIHDFVDIMTYFIWDIFTVTSIMNNKLKKDLLESAFCHSIYSPSRTCNKY